MSDDKLVEALRAERDALLQKPLDMAKMDSVDEGIADKMLAYYWYEQAQEARAALQSERSSMEGEIADPAELVGIAKAVAFYADPENWHGVYMVGSGPMASDWDDVEHPQYPGGKPGKRAREAIEAYLAFTSSKTGDEPK